MNIESIFIWEDAKATLPTTDKQTSDYLLFTMDDQVYCGYLDHSGYFRVLNSRDIGLAPFQPEAENFCPNWEVNLTNEDFPIVSRWVYLKDIYPKLDLVKDKLIRAYEKSLYSDNSFTESILKRAIDYCTDLYNQDKLNFIPPTISCGKGTLELKWLGKNSRSVCILLKDEHDILVCDSKKFTQNFFPFTIYKLIDWLAWLSK